MNVNARIIDADGHVRDRDADIRAHMEEPWSKRQGSLLPTDEWDSSMFGTLGMDVTDVPTRLRDMDTEGIEVSVLFPTGAFHVNRLPEKAYAGAFARAYNNWISAMCSEAPERLKAIGIAPFQDVDLAAAELQRVKSLGLHGVELLSNVNGKSLGEPEFLSFFQAAEELDVPLFVHAQHATFMDRVVGPGFIENIVAFPLEGALGIAGMITGGLMEACPRLRLCFSHGGGAFTQLLPRMENAWHKNPRFRELMPRKPSEYARMFFYDDVFFDNRTVRYLIDTVGAAQVVIGSDYPFNFRDQSPEDEFDDLGLTAEGREWVGSRNCLRFLGL